MAQLTSAQKKEFKPIHTAEQQLNAKVSAAKLLGLYASHQVIQHDQTGEVSGGWVFITNKAGQGSIELDFFKDEADCMMVAKVLGSKLGIGIVPYGTHTHLGWQVSGIIENWGESGLRRFYGSYEDALTAVLLLDGIAGIHMKDLSS